MTRRASLAWSANRLLALAWHRTRVVGRCPVPKSGPALLVANHTCGSDPIFLQAFTGRFVAWMMAEEFFGIPIASRIFRELGVIPVTRSGRDTAATRTALRMMADEGRVVGIFPEGRIERRRGEVLPFMPGVGLLARKARVPVIPACVVGPPPRLSTAAAYLWPQVPTVVWGEPVDPPAARENLNEWTERLRRTVAGLGQLRLA